MTGMRCLPREATHEPGFNCSLPPMGGRSRLAQSSEQVDAPVPISHHNLL